MLTYLIRPTIRQPEVHGNHRAFVTGLGAVLAVPLAVSTLTTRQSAMIPPASTPPRRCSAVAKHRNVVRNMYCERRAGRVVGIRVALVSRMRDRTSLRRGPTPLDVMDHVLGKGIIIEEPTSGATGATSTSHIALLEVTARVDVTTDADDALKTTR